MTAPGDFGGECIDLNDIEMVRTDREGWQRRALAAEADLRRLVGEGAIEKQFEERKKASTKSERGSREAYLEHVQGLLDRARREGEEWKERALKAEASVGRFAMAHQQLLERAERAERGEVGLEAHRMTLDHLEKAEALIDTARLRIENLMGMLDRDGTAKRWTDVAPEVARSNAWLNETEPRCESTVGDVPVAPVDGPSR